MASQASLNGGPGARRVEGVITSLGGLTGDIASLAELQTRLTLIDAKEAASRATWPTVVLIASAVALMTALPVLMIGLAFVLANAFAISQGGALLIVGGIIAAVAGAIAFLSLREFLHSFESFRRSRDEFTRNVNWIKTVLAQSTMASRR